MEDILSSVEGDHPQAYREFSNVLLLFVPSRLPESGERILPLAEVVVWPRACEIPTVVSMASS